jgi:signal transduction histidine kinase
MSSLAPPLSLPMPPAGPLLAGLVPDGSPAVAAFGWLLALTALALAGGLWLRLRRHATLVAEASHELRGPLSAVRLGLPALALGDPSRERRVAAIDLELRRASLALDDLAASGDGRHAVRIAEVLDVGELLADAAESWRPLAAAFGARVLVEPSPAPVLVRADPIRLVQACGNLVANAAEHGGGDVHVRTRVGEGRVRIEVTDGGPGLPAPVADLVRSSSRGRRGHGLAITARIAAGHGGRLAAAPSAHGARLVLELPCATAHPVRRRFRLPR